MTTERVEILLGNGEKIEGPGIFESALEDIGFGPAFPFEFNNQFVNDKGKKIPMVCSGMTIRQYFVAQAMEGLMANSKEDAWDLKPEQFAAACLQFADACLDAEAKSRRTKP